MKRHYFLLLPPLLIAFQNCTQEHECPSNFGAMATRRIAANASTSMIPYVQTVELHPKRFANCSELSEWSKGRQQSGYGYVDDMGYDWTGGAGSGDMCGEAVASHSVPNDANGGTDSGSITNLQERGVDEADIFKADADYLYYARKHSVEIVAVSSLTVVQTLQLPTLEGIKLFLDAGQLVVLAKRIYSSPAKLVVQKFRRVGAAMAASGEINVPGELHSARLTSGRLTLVMKSSAPNDPDGAGKVLGVPCEKIHRPMVDNYGLAMTTVHQIALNDLSANSLGLYGEPNQIYMTDNNLYIDFNANVYLNQFGQNQVIAKLDMQSNAVLTAAGVVPGYIRNVWAMKEIGNRFYIATTYTSGAQENRLWVMRSNAEAELEIAGSTQDFGTREDIRSVRYIGDKAYVVTFRQTDPVYAFDLSAGDNPPLLSELELPGFSAYLHPIGNNRMLGVGYGARGTSGLQLSVFDLTQPEHISLVEQNLYGGPYSRADVTNDHHAFYYEDGIVGLPAVLFKSNTYYYNSDLEFSGAMFIKFSPGMTVAGRVSHQEWISASCKSQYLQRAGSWDTALPSIDVRRVTKAGGLLISVSPFGVKASDPVNGFATVKSVRFAEDGDCGN